MKRFLKYLLILTAIILTACQPSKKDNNHLDISSITDTLVSVENDSTKLTFSLLGGALIDFEDKIVKINPFLWKNNNPDTIGDNNNNNAILQGQYISFGRWSAPTQGELKMGMPPNGEFASNWWKLKPDRKESEITMSCEAPMDGFSITRHVVMSQSGPLFKVTETITNENSTGRTSNIVQNISLVAPFFEPSIVINSNASFGFNQMLDVPDPARFEYQWPKALTDTLRISTTDISTFSSRFSYLSSHIFQDTIGWVTIYNPRLKLLLGYAWKTIDYPWIHFRNEINYGKQHFHGLAFGTTGLGDKFPFADRLATTFHGVKNFDFIDAKCSLSKSWYCFFLSVPQGYEKTSGILLVDSKLVLQFFTYSGIKEVKLSL
jgi:hypothetical protein